MTKEKTRKKRNGVGVSEWASRLNIAGVWEYAEWSRWLKDKANPTLHHVSSKQLAPLRNKSWTKAPAPGDVVFYLSKDGTRARALLVLSSDCTGVLLVPFGKLSAELAISMWVARMVLPARAVQKSAKDLTPLEFTAWVRQQAPVFYR